MCGWAYGLIDDRDPTFGCWQLPHEGGEGGLFASFENELMAAMAALQPGRLILEKPLSFQALLGVSNMKVMAQQLTLRGFAFAEAWRADVPISEVSSDVVRLAMLGQSRFKRGEVKGEVFRYCHARGWKVPDHNAGDACLTWAWEIMQLRGGVPPPPGRLFATEMSL